MFFVNYVFVVSTVFDTMIKISIELLRNYKIKLERKKQQKNDNIKNGVYIHGSVINSADTWHYNDYSWCCFGRENR